MKLNNIKTILGAVAIASFTGVMTTSCVNDLDVENLNPQQVSTLDKDALFNKIYSSFVLTGQEGPAGSGDIADADEGRSEFYRMVWNLNELTTDEAHWVWYKNDTGYEDLVENTYGADNAVSMGLYYRIYFTITLCNHYLANVPDDGTDETKARRAEVRFIRAYNYYTVMDLYGNAAFTEVVSNTPGEYYKRADFFKYVEKELLEIESDLKDVKADGDLTYGRVSRCADWLMLSRLYLNAEVYTGEQQWQKAMDYAEKVINNGYYKLNTQGAVNPETGEEYSAYQMLFLADNDKNGAQYENILPVLHDGINTKSYGGMHSLILASYASEMSDFVPSGTSNSWGKCNRVKGKLSKIFFGDNNADNICSVAEATALADDARALIYSNGYSRDILNEDDANAGYACVKFRNVRSDGKPASTSDSFVDTDLPLMRMAEAYLNYAEASTRLNGPNQDAADKIDTLRKRANAHEAGGYSLEDIRDEWAKEFWFEGRRRMDLVRFNSYGGQSSYKWEWMGNAEAGQKFSATKNIFGIPNADLTNNPNLKQNAGY